MSMRSTKDLKDIVTGVRAQSKNNGIAGNAVMQEEKPLINQVKKAETQFFELS